MKKQIKNQRFDRWPGEQAQEQKAFRQGHEQHRQNALLALESLTWFIQLEPKATEIIGMKELQEMKKVDEKLTKLMEYLGCI